MARYTTAQLFGGDDDLANRVEWQESRGKQGAVSPKGAFGVMQLMPDTAKDPGFGVAPLDPNAPDPEVENRRVGRDYLNAMLNRYGGDQEAALVAYNWGPGNADKWVAGGKDRSRLPRETQGYLANILDKQAQQAAQAEPMRLGPSEGKKRYSTQELFAPKAPEVSVAGSVGGSHAPKGITGTAKVRPPVSGAEYADDAMNSYLANLLKGAAALVGLPGDLIKGGRWLAGKAGFEPTNTPVFGSEEALAGIQRLLGSNLDYQPKTELGDVVGRTAAIAPSLVGGTGVVRPLAQAAGIGMASKTAGDVGRMFSPEAGMVGDVAGAYLGARQLSKPTLPRGPAIRGADIDVAGEAAAMTPGTAALKRISQENYSAAKAAGVSIKGDHFHNFMQQLANDSRVRRLALNPAKYPTLKADVDQMLGAVPGAKAPGAMSALTGVRPQWSPRNIDLDEFDNFRQVIGSYAKSPHAGEREVAGHIARRMDAFFDNLNPTNATGDIRTAQKVIGTARNNWRLHEKAKEIDTIIESAKDSAGQLVVSGTDNSLVTGFRSLSKRINKDPRVAKKFTKDEIQLIRRLSRRTNIRAMLRGTGAALNNPLTRGAALFGGGAYSYSTEDPTAILWGLFGLGVGKGARGMAGRLAKKDAAHLQQLVQGGGQLRGKTPGAAPLAGTLALNPYLGQ